MDQETNLYEIDQYDQVSKYNPQPTIQQELFILKIDVGQGNHQSLIVHEGSDPRFLAINFCQTYNLVDDAMAVLEDTIRQNMEYKKSFIKFYIGSIVHYSDNQNYSIVSGRQKQSIFDRLHQEAYDKKQRQQIMHARENTQQTFQKKPLSQSHGNSGQKLYRKGQLQQGSQRRKIENEKARQMIYNREDSYQPYVSERSSRIVDSKRKNECFHDHLINQGKISEQKKVIARTEKLIIELNECSFQPDINQISKKIMEEKLKSNYDQSDTHQKLYQESYKIQAKRNQMERAIQFDHRPQNLSNSKFEGQTIPFLERMAISVEEKQAKYQISSQSKEDFLNDPITGQEFFRPIICRPPMIDRNIDCLPIGEYLYQMRDPQQQKLNQKILEQNQNLQNSKAKTIKKSNDIYHNVKLKALEEIFNIMDIDQDGLINANSIEAGEFNFNVIQILAPLICEMRLIKAELNKQQFCESANRLIQSLSVGDRDQLLSGYKKKTYQDQSIHSFQPILNKKSLLMANSQRSKSFDRIRLDEKQSQMKIQRDQQELKECTFKPTLYKPFKCYDFSSNDKISENSLEN